MAQRVAPLAATGVYTVPVADQDECGVVVLRLPVDQKHDLVPWLQLSARRAASRGGAPEWSCDACTYDNPAAAA
eukprot:gene33615-4684_t